MWCNRNWISLVVKLKSRTFHRSLIATNSCCNHIHTDVAKFQPALQTVLLFRSESLWQQLWLTDRLLQNFAEWLRIILSIWLFHWMAPLLLLAALFYYKMLSSAKAGLLRTDWVKEATALRSRIFLRPTFIPESRHKVSLTLLQSVVLPYLTMSVLKLGSTWIQVHMDFSKEKGCFFMLVIVLLNATFHTHSVNQLLISWNMHGLPTGARQGALVSRGCCWIWRRHPNYAVLQISSLCLQCSTPQQKLSHGITAQKFQTVKL